QHGYIRTAYSYAPFGAVTESGDVTQPLQWSSEHYDSELDLVYYNYRHYSPSLGRFLSRDPIAEQGGLNLYAFVGNDSYILSDNLGLLTYVQADGNFGHAWIRMGNIEFLSAVVNNVHYIALIPQGIGFYPANDESKLTYLFTGSSGVWTAETAKEIGLALNFFTATEYSLKQITRNDMFLQYGAKTKCECASDDARLKCLEEHPLSANTYNLLFSNCRQAAQDVLTDCCWEVDFSSGKVAIPGYVKPSKSLK
ncbi:MAG: RHS repeat-associated core domain-containing protein, partial [Opitutales bacterium]|nr:RHS repeat-associated core domain-containing protein [Opitutales bacterium]